MLIHGQGTDEAHMQAGQRRCVRVFAIEPQVEKAIKTRKAKAVLLAPNIASLEPGDFQTTAEEGRGSEEAEGGGAGGGGGTASTGGGTAGCPASALLALAQEREVPLVFALSRQKMGKVRRVA